MEKEKWHVGDSDQSVYDEQGFEIAEVASYMRIHENWSELGVKHWSEKEGVSCVSVTDEKVLETAKLIAAAPEMLQALEVALIAISVEDVEAYDIVEKAIKTAKGGTK